MEIYSALATAVLALIGAIIINVMIRKKPAGNEKMMYIAGEIAKGARAFMIREGKMLSVFVVIVAIVLFFLLDKKDTPLQEGFYTALCFVIGAVISFFAGYFGMKTSTTANVRTAEAARHGLNPALRISFNSGASMGLSVVGLGLLGVTGLYWYLVTYMGIETTIALEMITGFGLGGSSIALFARVGGGIYTKAADVGADLVGKVEAGIPEDDPRNPAVIADNVGDNVGDVAGMGADLFESYVGSLIAAFILGYAAFQVNGIYLPLTVCAAGILASIIGMAFVRTKNEKGILSALKRGLFVSSALVIVASWFLCQYFLAEQAALGVFIALTAGILVGVIVGLITEYYTASQYSPVQKLAKASLTGAATVIIEGIALGYRSTALSVLFIVSAIYVSFEYAGLYGIAMAAMGMVSTLGISLAIDAFGPVADNAGGIAEMAGMGPEIRKRTDALDAVGNTTAAIGKGFAIGSAALAAVALFAAYTEAAHLSAIDVAQPRVMIGLLLGACLPFLFSSMTMGAVGRAAMSMVEEVRRQFKEIKGLLEGKAEPETEKCVDIATAGALKEMIMPGVLILASPVVVGYLLGTAALGGLLAGSLAAGVMLAISMANSGGAWDNAKKYIEAGHYGGKKSDPHKAAVVGDTVGDPFKDTSGPSNNTLIKLMSMVSLILAGVLSAEGIL
jgi:K(+)-stimulated pyrophosphate-energized sodium pump